MLVIRAGIHKMLIRIANREDPDQKQSDVSLSCLSKPFWQTPSVPNFRTFTLINRYRKNVSFNLFLICSILGC